MAGVLWVYRWHWAECVVQTQGFFAKTKPIEIEALNAKLKIVFFFSLFFSIFSLISMIQFKLYAFESSFEFRMLHMYPLIHSRLSKLRAVWNKYYPSNIFQVLRLITTELEFHVFCVEKWKNGDHVRFRNRIQCNIFESSLGSELQHSPNTPSYITKCRKMVFIKYEVKKKREKRIRVNRFQPIFFLSIEHL